jgi:hypothetical protein
MMNRELIFVLFILFYFTVFRIQLTADPDGMIRGLEASISVLRELCLFGDEVLVHTLLAYYYSI